MQNTQNYKLGLPELDEQYDLNVVNNNNIKIDTELKTNADNISAETTRAKKEEKTLTENLTGEIERSTTKENGFESLSNSLFKQNLFNFLIPVGVTYPQYPNCKSPIELWGSVSEWAELVGFNSAFFSSDNAPAEFYSIDNKNYFRDNLLKHPILFPEGTQITDSGRKETNSQGQQVTIYTSNLEKGVAQIFENQKKPQDEQLPNIKGNWYVPQNGIFDQRVKMSGPFKLTQGPDVAPEYQSAGHDFNVSFDASRSAATYKDPVDGVPVKVRPENWTKRIWVRTK